MTSIAKSWDRICACARNNEPELLDNLNPGASEDQLARLQELLGLELPETYLDCLRIANGEREDWRSGLFGEMGGFLSCEHVVENWRRGIKGLDHWDEIPDDELASLIADQIFFVQGPVRPISFDPAWIPFLVINNGDVVWALDFAPTEGGVPGQVIRVDVEGCDWKVAAPDFASFLEAAADALEDENLAFTQGAPPQ